MANRYLQLTDLQLISQWCATSLQLIDYDLLAEIQKRSLYDVINHLPQEQDEAKALAYARMIGRKQAFGSAEIDEIAGIVLQVERLKVQLQGVPVTEPGMMLEILEPLTSLTKQLDAYLNK